MEMTSKKPIEIVVDEFFCIAIKRVENHQSRLYILKNHSSLVFMIKKFKSHYLTSQLLRKKPSFF